MNQDPVVILAAARTPVGSAAGPLQRLREEEMLGQLLAGIVTHAKIPAGEIASVIAGSVLAEGRRGYEAARDALLVAGWPDSIQRTLVQRHELSGLEAMLLACDRVSAHSGGTVLAGGFDRVEPAQLAAAGTTCSPVRLTQRPDETLPLLLAAESWAANAGLLRAHLDRAIRLSHEGYARWSEAGFSPGHILPLRWRETSWSMSGYTATDVSLAADELPRDDISEELLAAAPSAIGPGQSHSRMACAVGGSGAAFAAIARASCAAGYGIRPLARILATSSASGCTGDIGATMHRVVEVLLDRSGLGAGDIDLWRANEDYAVIPLLLAREFGIAEERLNAGGGMLAYGHASGASSAVELVNLVHELHWLKKRTGIIACTSRDGQAIAMLLERG